MTLLPKPGVPFLTDAGLETCLVFKEGFELPAFAAFVLLDDPRGLDSLKAYYRGFLDLAERHGTGLVLDMPSWRANPDWGAAIGFDRAALAAVNRAALAMIAGLRDESPIAERVVLNLVVGPRGDGYRADSLMTEQQARDYHGWQIGGAAEAGADIATGLTMTYAAEARGIAAAAADAGLPCIISFTVETDGRLPDGMPLAEAVRRVDDGHGDTVAYYMVNCANPAHFASVLDDSELAARIGGIRANASRKSHAELDAAEQLDEGDPDELARDCRDLLSALPNLCVIGGCCGTDHRHVEAMARECLPLMRR